jgi:hypothetical protein
LTVNASSQPGQTPPSTWLLLDLCVDQAPAVATAVVDQRITWALQQLQRLTVIACRAQKQPPPQLVILADPTRPADLERCRRRLTPLTTGPIYLLGATGVESRETIWQQKAATALAALIWTQLPPPSEAPPMDGRHPSPANAPFYAIGAVAQPFPPHAVIRALSLLATAEALQALMTPPPAAATADDGAAAPAPLTALTTQLLADKTTLPQQPAPPPVRLRRHRPTWWRNSANPVAMLLAHANLQQRDQQRTAGAARTAWLAAQLATWDAAWQSLRRIATEPTDAAARALHDDRALTQLRRHLLTLAQGIEDELATLATAIQRHEAQTDLAAQALTAFCGDLPTLSLDGVWRFCRHPAHWPRWLWQLSVGLPWQLRRLSRCLTQQQRALHTEANLHLRRQLALAMLQDVAQALAWRRELRAHLTTLAAYLAEQLAATEGQLPNPWARDRVEQLLHELIRTDGAASHPGLQSLRALLQHTAAEEWVDGAVEGVGESLVAQFAVAFAPLHDWSVDAWLRAAFPTSGQSAAQYPAPAKAPEKGRWSKWRNGLHPPAKSAVEQWLDGLATDARPLWPTASAVTTAAITALPEVWLALPMPAEPWAPTTPNIDIEPHPELHVWAAAQPHRGCLSRPFQAIVLIQRVNLA